MDASSDPDDPLDVKVEENTHPEFDGAPPTNLLSNQPTVTIVYTDAAYKEPSDKKKTEGETGIGVWFGQNDPRNVSQKLGGLVSSTVGEVEAAIRAADIIRKECMEKECRGKQHVIIKTDCLNIVDTMNHGSKHLANIKKEHLRSVYWRLFESVAKLPRCITVDVQHIHAHSDGADNYGNQEADRLARAAIGLKRNLRIKRTSARLKGQEPCPLHDTSTDELCPEDPSF